MERLIIDLGTISSTELRGIYQILKNGAKAVAEEAPKPEASTEVKAAEPVAQSAVQVSEPAKVEPAVVSSDTPVESVVDTKPQTEESQKDSPLCHKSPPAGYPKDKEDYGDPECYRYPLNTKSRCLAAWRYVNKAENTKILGEKAASVKARIKSYAKKHYDLELQTEGAAEEDWYQNFVEFYDSETSGEGFADIETKMVLLTQEAEVIGKELKAVKSEYEKLLQFKKDKEQEEAKTKLLASRRAKVEEAGLSINLEAESGKWLEMSDEQFEFTLSKMTEVQKLAAASQQGIKIPAVTGDKPVDHVARVREGFAKLRKQ